MTTDHYDKQGRPMSFEDWSRVFGDISYRRVAETTLPGGGSVSTVWLGLDHGWGSGPPLIFETMVFGVPGWDGEQDRCSTLSEAHLMHAAMVERVAKPRETP